MSNTYISDLAHAMNHLTMAEIMTASPQTAFGKADRKSRKHLLATVAGLSQEEQMLIFSAASAKAKFLKKPNQDLNVLSMQEIIAVSPEGKIDRGDKRTRERLLSAVADLSEKEREMVHVAAGKKRCHASDGMPACKRQKLEKEVDEYESWEESGSDTTNTSTVEREELGVDEDFLRAPKEGVVEKCISNFIDRTSNEALARQTCMSCARTVWRHETTECKVLEIPNPEHLYPYDEHHAYVLTSGMLLHNRALRNDAEGQKGSLCHDCIRDLKARKRPKFSLSNGMWVGEVPYELLALTLPEKILIARYYPAAYVVKLFLKVKGARHWNPEGLNSGVRGNVSTYRLNITDIIDMVDLNILPPPARMLAAVIAVTIIGPKGFPEKTMPGFLRVRRSRVREALIWLKANNPLYANIEICEQTLGQFPEDDIPEEILGTTKYSDDVMQRERERAGYVVEDDDEELEKGM
jgi:hypothetical protein